MTPAFFSLDQILSRMNQPDYSIKNANMLDKIAHELHMQEGWTLAGKHYQVPISGQQRNKYLIRPHELTTLNWSPGPGWREGDRGDLLVPGEGARQ